MSGLLRYEWIRFSTIRSTWIMIGLAILAAAIPTFLIGLLASNIAQMASGGPNGPGVPGGPDVNYTTLLSLGLTFATIFLAVIGAQAIGQEYRHGLIRMLLSSFPRRSQTLSVKLAFIAVVTVISAIVVILFSYLAFWLSVRGKSSVNLVWGSNDTVITFRSVLYVLCFVLIAFALSLITRNLPIGIVVPIVLAMFVEPIANTIILATSGGLDGNAKPSGFAKIVTDVLPFTNGAKAMTDAPDAWGGLCVFGIWTVVLLAIGWVLFEKRDA